VTRPFAPYFRAGPGFAAYPAAALALALGFVAGCQGCHRQIRFLPAGVDSVQVGADSLRSVFRHAQDEWEDPSGGEDAARATAFALGQDLKGHADEPWGARARRLLDSLDVGAEIAADGRVLVVNFFARARPEAGAWPWVFWKAPPGVTSRALMGRNLQLLQVATRPDPAGGPEGWSQVAVLFGRRGMAGREPLLMVWGPPAGQKWTPIQTLGPDSLGGVGTAEFQLEGDSTVALVARTFRGMPRFEECATCPHVYMLHRFRWQPEGYVRVEDIAVPSPYATFVQFIQALGAGDREAAERLVADPGVLEQARQYDFGALPKGIWRAAPASDENTFTMVFFRGQQEAYQVSFDSRGENWLISGVRATTRAIE